MLNSTSMVLATAQLPHCRNQPMLAPFQMKFDTVRDPTTKSQSSVKGSSFVQVPRVEGAVGLADADQVGVDLGEPATDRCAVALPWLQHLAGRGHGHLSEVPSAALLLTTRMSSTMPSLSKALMVSAMLSFSL